jgi:uncharacterized protein YjiS (DUF1127 family)
VEGSVHTIAGDRRRASGISWEQVAGVCRRALALLGAWRERERERQELARLDDRLLADVGISPEQRARECAKCFWR